MILMRKNWPPVQLEERWLRHCGRPLWKTIHEGLVDKPIIDASPVELGLVKRTVCAVSGKLATEACSFDANGLVPITDWFDKSTAPTETCDMHVLTQVCMDSEQPASPYCTNVQMKSVILVGSRSYISHLLIQRCCKSICRMQ